MSSKEIRSFRLKMEIFKFYLRNTSIIRTRHVLIMLKCESRGRRRAVWLGDDRDSVTRHLRIEIILIKVLSCKRPRVMGRRLTQIVYFFHVTNVERAQRDTKLVIETASRMRPPRAPLIPRSFII